MIRRGSVQVMFVGIALLTACASAPPAELPNFAEPVHIEPGDAVTGPEPIERPLPDLSGFVQAGVSGVTRLRLRVERNGTVSDVQEIAGIDPRLTATLVEAVKRWHFKPATVRGEPVAAFFDHAEWTLTPFTKPAVDRVLAPPDREEKRK